MDTILHYIGVLWDWFIILIYILFAFCIATSGRYNIVLRIIIVGVTGLICFSGHPYIANILVFLPAISALDYEDREREKRIGKAIDAYLANKNIIKVNNLGPWYLAMIPENDSDKSYLSEMFNDKSRQEFYDKIRDFGKKYLKEKTNNKDNHIVAINALGDRFYMLQETIDEMRIIYERARSNGPDVFWILKIGVNLGGDKGLQNNELMAIYEQVIPNFNHVQCKDYPELMISRDYAANHICQKCHNVFLESKNIYNYYGTIYCTDCLEQVQQAERNGESMVMEVSPDQVPVSGDLADIFSELEGR